MIDIEEENMEMDYEAYGFDTEEEYLDSLKQEDSYHFTIPFEFIKTNYGDGKYDIGTANMEVDVIWDETDHGYVKYYYCPQEEDIDPNQGNADIDDFYENDVDYQVDELLGFEGITTSAISIFTYKK